MVLWVGENRVRDLVRKCSDFARDFWVRVEIHPNRTARQCSKVGASAAAGGASPFSRGCANRATSLFAAAGIDEREEELKHERIGLKCFWGEECLNQVVKNILAWTQTSSINMTSEKNASMILHKL